MDLEAQSMDPPGGMVKKARKSLGSFFKKAPSASIRPEQAMEAEVNNYMLSPTIDSEANPLAWWQKNKSSFPHLSKLARKYLCIPATSSPSERLFSTSGNIVSCQRASLKPQKVNMLVFLAKNLP